MRQWHIFIQTTLLLASLSISHASWLCKDDILLDLFTLHGEDKYCSVNATDLSSQRTAPKQQASMSGCGKFRRPNFPLQMNQLRHLRVGVEDLEQ